MSSETISSLTKADIVNHLNDINITPSKDGFPLFKTMFFEHLCSKLSITMSEVPDQIKKFDIYKIKKLYSDFHCKVDRMIKYNETFFNAPIKPKRLAPVSETASATASSSTSTVVVFKKSHSNLILHVKTKHLFAYSIDMIWFAKIKTDRKSKKCFCTC